MAALDDYLASLPQGLDGYPEQRSKASSIRSKLSLCPQLADHDGLPAPLRAWLEDPPLSSEWVPSAHAFALNMAICDVLGGDEAFMAFIAKHNRELLSSPLYRAAFLVISPKRILKHVPSRFAHFHRGFDVTLDMAPSTATLRLGAPPHLVNRLMARAVNVPLHIGLELAGLADPDIELVDWEPACSTYRVNL